MKTTKMARMVVTALFAAVVFLFLFAGQAWAQPTHHHRHGPRYGQKSESSSTAKPKTKAPANAHNPENWHPLTLDEQVNEIEKGSGDPSDPKANIGDSLGYFYRNAKRAVEPVALEAWRIALILVFDALMFVILFVVILMIPGFAAKWTEMPIEAVLLFIVGLIMFNAEWVGGIGMQGWVAFCLLIPAGILFIVSFFAKEGTWKVLLLFGPITFMCLLQGLGAVNSLLTWAWHSPLLAFCVLVILVSILRHGGKHETAH